MRIMESWDSSSCACWDGEEGGDDGGFYKQDGSVLPDPKTHPPIPQKIRLTATGEPQDPTEGDSISWRTAG